MSSASLRIAATRRQLSWNCRQRPTLGLALSPASEPQSARSPSSCAALWLRQLEILAHLGLGAILLPRWSPEVHATLEEILHRAHTLGLIAVLEVDAVALADVRHAHGHAELLRQHPGSFLLVRAPREEPDEPWARQLEEAALSTFRRHGIGVAFASDDVLGPGLRTLRSLSAHTLFADGLLLGAEPKLAPLSLLGRCLAVRPERRPALVRACIRDAAELRRVAATALSAGHAMCLFEVPWDGDELPEAELIEVRRLQSLLGCLPVDVGEPPDAPLRVWTRSTLLADPAHIDPTLAALALAHHGGLACDLLVDDFRDGRAEFAALWVPAHGVLDADTWTSLVRHAWRGATVIVTGFEPDALAEERIRFLQEPEPKWNLQDVAQSPWLELPHGSGFFVFTQQRPELTPRARASQAFVERVTRLAELRSEPADPASLQRAVQFGTWATLRADLGTGDLRLE